MEFEVVLEVGVAEVALCVKILLEDGTVGRNLFLLVDGPYLVVHVHHSIVAGSRRHIALLLLKTPSISTFRCLADVRVPCASSKVVWIWLVGEALLQNVRNWTCSTPKLPTCSCRQLASWRLIGGTGM